jgi:serine/threonine protein kinase/Flp pilus assembly protein TadD
MRTFPSREPGKAVRDDGSSLDLDAFIEDFETAWARRGEADLADFLPPRQAPLYLEVLCELIRVDLELRWQKGSPRSLDDYERAFPEAFENSETRGQIVFEERRLRLQAEISSSRLSGPKSPTSTPDPQSEPASDVVAAAWKQVKHAALVSPLSGDHANDIERADLLPTVGSDFLGFQLIGELGVGAFSKVYLARQGELADRFVVLKVAADTSSESQKLAQLQHTNIVPVYSVHRVPPLQAVCMPFYGSTTLKDVIHDLYEHDTLPTSGKDLLNAVSGRNHSLLANASSQPEAGASMDLRCAPVGRAPGNPAIQDLGYVQATLCIGARLAEGLSHAHERGILHCDLKPANVLLTEDGQPLLLDFNMSRDLKLHRPLCGVGGTPLYMAPEHLQAFRGADEEVDARSDIYSLGVILYQLLTGRFPFAIRLGRLSAMVPLLLEDRLGPVPHLRPWNPAVTPAAEAIVRHCLEPDPKRRYQSAAELLEDLNLHEHDKPLRHAPEPSWKERLAKWIRRHPRLSSGASVASIALAAIALLSALSLVGWRYRSQMLARQSLESFSSHMKNAQFLMYGRPPNTEQLDRASSECQEAMRPYRLPADANWEQASVVQSLPPETRQQLREDMGELLYLAARARWQPGGPNSVDTLKDKARQALEFNSLAIPCYESAHVPSAIWEQRAMLLEQAGDPRAAREYRARAQAAPLVTARDYYLQAHAYAHAKEFRKALPLFDRATQMNPRDFMAWFVKGNCHDFLEQYASAEAAYSVCVSIRPEVEGAWLNRGYARLMQQSFQPALLDFDQVLNLEPGCADAYINRALARQGLGDYSKAIEDFTRVLELEPARTQVYFMRAVAREHVGDRAGARKDRREGMRLEPEDEAGWIARGLARQESDAAGALHDFDAALAINPMSARALQNKAHVLGECLGKNREAIAVLDTAIHLFPDNFQLCAGRGVHRARLGDDEEALSDARRALRLNTEPSNLYQVACIFALTAKRRPENRPRACELLARALVGGFGLEFVDKDSDFDPIRDSAEYRHVIEAVRPQKNRKK